MIWPRHVDKASLGAFYEVNRKFSIVENGVSDGDGMFRAEAHPMVIRSAKLAGLTNSDPAMHISEYSYRSLILNDDLVLSFVPAEFAHRDLRTLMNQSASVTRRQRT